MSDVKLNTELTATHNFNTALVLPLQTFVAGRPDRPGDTFLNEIKVIYSHKVVYLVPIQRVPQHPIPSVGESSGVLQLVQG